jgi:hypothetical protein
VKEDKTGRWKTPDWRQSFIIFYRTGMGIMNVLLTSAVMGPSVGAVYYLSTVPFPQSFIEAIQRPRFFDDVAISVGRQANLLEYIEIRRKQIEYMTHEQGGKWSG